MAVGDVVSGISSIAAGSSLTIQPGAGVEWVLHNLYHAADVEVYFTDGANSIKFSSDTSFGAWTGMFLHANNTRYFTIKNTNAAAQLIGYDGIVTK
jgi:hypothetical protein